MLLLQPPDIQRVRASQMPVPIVKQRIFIRVLIVLTMTGVVLVDLRMTSGETPLIPILHVNDHAQVDTTFRQPEQILLVQSGVQHML